MDWYYAINETQGGPVSADELDRLLHTGVISSNSMVWRDGMADWQPYHAVRTMPAPPPITAKPVVTHQVPIARPPVAAVARQQPRRPTATAGLRVWRSGNLVVAKKDAMLPCRCVRCGENATLPKPGETLERTLSWQHPLSWIIVIALGIVVTWAIIAFCNGHWDRLHRVRDSLSKTELREKDGAFLKLDDLIAQFAGKAITYGLFGIGILQKWVFLKHAKIKLCLCSVHSTQKAKHLACAGALVLLGVLLAVSAFIGWLNPWFVLIGIIASVASSFYWQVAYRVVRVKRITRDYVFLKGISPQFMETLPKFPKEQER